MSRLTFVLPAAVLAAALGSASLAPPGTAQRAAVTADRPRLGYRLPQDGTAAGGWLGSRKLGTDVVYRVDPAKGPTTRSFGKAHWVATFAGSGPVVVTTADTQRAAWIVSKYGGYRSKVQGAAVEVALDALLHGGDYAVDGKATSRRLTQSGARKWILPLVTDMLAASARRAGPYTVEVTAENAPVGQPVAVAVTVRSAAGVPIRALPVQIGLDGYSTFSETGDDGVARAELTAGTAGPREVQVLVAKLPEHRLLVRAPAEGRGSRVVLAGRKRAKASAASIAVQARPDLAISGPGVAVVGTPVVGSLAVSEGYASPRSATVALRGPFASTGAAACSGDPVAGEVAVPVTANASYDVPAITVGQIGYYRWSAAVPGDTYNLPAADCGSVLTVKARPVASVKAVDASLAVGASARAKVAVSALPDSYAGEAISRLYGPFALRSGVGCDSAKLVGRRDLAITGPASQGQTNGIKLSKKGFYGWQTTVQAAPLSLRVVTPCGAAGSLVKVG